MASLSCSNAASACTTPTADGSGQVIHPSVIDFGAGATWNGHRYWMAVSGYAGGQDIYENTHILASDDGNTWAAPTGLTNPLATAGEGTYYSDPELVYHDGTMYVFDRYTVADPSNETLLQYRYSTDGITWSAPVSILTGMIGATMERSPCVVWDGSQFVMYTCMDTLVRRRTVAAIIDGVWSDPVTIPDFGINTWHLHIFRDVPENAYFAIKQIVDGTLYFLMSCDGLTWYPRVAPILTVSAAGWDKDQLYRASITGNSSALTMWYSGQNTNVWHVGKTTIS